MNRSTLIILLILAIIPTAYAWLWAVGIVELPEFDLCACLAGAAN